jgi:hypothetical protein
LQMDNCPTCAQAALHNQTSPELISQLKASPCVPPVLRLLQSLKRTRAHCRGPRAQEGFTSSTKHSTAEQSCFMAVDPQLLGTSKQTKVNVAHCRVPATVCQKLSTCTDPCHPGRCCYSRALAVAGQHPAHLRCCVIHNKYMVYTQVHRRYMQDTDNKPGYCTSWLDIYCTTWLNNGQHGHPARPQCLPTTWLQGGRLMASRHPPQPHYCNAAARVLAAAGAWQQAS